MAARELQVGDAAPPFALKTSGGETVALSGFAGKWVVLYFYPKDDTPGCTKEACGFQDALPKFMRADTAVLGVSGDDTDSHERFAKKFGLTFPLLSDPDRKVSAAYGVFKEKSMYGRVFMGIERATFLIGPDGRLAAIFPKVKVDGHIDEVLAALRSASATAAKN